MHNAFLDFPPDIGWVFSSSVSWAHWLKRTKTNLVKSWFSCWYLEKCKTFSNFWFCYVLFIPRPREQLDFWNYFSKNEHLFIELDFKDYFSKNEVLFIELDFWNYFSKNEHLFIVMLSKPQKNSQTDDSCSPNLKKPKMMIRALQT